MNIDKKLILANIHWDRNIPVDLDTIANKIGLEVFSFDPIQDGVDINIAGFVGKNNTCYINSYDIVERRRYTLACFIVCKLLNLSYEEFTEDDLFGNKQNAIDLIILKRLANKVIMPELAVNYLIEKEKNMNIELLAKRLYVSEKKMKERLIELKWL